MPRSCWARRRGAEDVSLSPPVFLPDGTEFRAWECRTKWTRTYVVDQMHPEASDENPGTSERPFRTIGRAAEAWPRVSA